MPKVKITSVPPGGAPLAIREKWVGLELPLEEVSEPGIMRSVTGGAPNPKSFGGFPVKTGNAIAALHASGAKEAATWWATWYAATGYTGKTLVFAPTCGELVDEAVDVEARVVDEGEAKRPKGCVAAMTAANRRS